MQLGAKYELILVGLFDDIVRTHSRLDEIELLHSESLKRLEQDQIRANEVLRSLEVDKQRFESAFGEVDRLRYECSDNLQQARKLATETQEFLHKSAVHIDSIEEGLERQKRINLFLLCATALSVLVGILL